MFKPLVVFALGLTAFWAPLPTAAQPQPSSAHSFAPDFYRVHEAEHGYVRAERVILFRRLQSSTGNEAHWFVERQERFFKSGSQSTSYAWIDSQACDEVGVALRGLDALPRLVVRGPASLASWSRPPPFHHPVVTLEAGPVSMGGSDVQVSIVDATGPVANWWLESQDALKHCWREGDAVLDGTPVSPRLPEVEAWRN